MVALTHVANLRFQPILQEEEVNGNLNLNQQQHHHTLPAKKKLQQVRNCSHIVTAKVKEAQAG